MCADRMISNDYRIIKLSSSSRQLKYISSTSIHNAQQTYINDDDTNCISSTINSDLIPHIYEGGFKVWECAVDLCNYIDQTFDHTYFIDKCILELGCGAGLPGILTLQLGAKHVCFQDYNRSVIECFTKNNVQLNDDGYLIKCNFISGDWADEKLRKAINGQIFDVILTAETIYDSTSYPHLHDIIDATLSSVGVAFIAAKQCYFGVGGDIYTFIEYVKQRGKFNIIDRWCSDSDIPRRILELTRIPSN